MANRLDRYFEQQMRNPRVRKLVEQEVADLEVGILIARLRESLRMNQTQLAARAGMNASKISKIESSPKNVTLNTLTRIAHALNRKVKIDFVPISARRVAIAHKRETYPKLHRAERQHKQRSTNKANRASIGA
jgi:transcriptional regulator with XRE-family HTH domain